MMLQTQLTRLIRAIQYKSASSQVVWDANVSNPRRIPDTINERNPAQNHLWCCPGPTKRMRPIAKNSPDRVGRMTLPAQFVRLNIPFSNDIGSLPLTSFENGIFNLTNWAG